MVPNRDREYVSGGYVSPSVAGRRPGTDGRRSERVAVRARGGPSAWRTTDVDDLSRTRSATPPKVSQASSELQHGVAHGVAVQVVGLLEPVDIDIEHDHAAAASTGPEEGVARPARFGECPFEEAFASLVRL